jgi:heat shock protein HslJ/uncharacterized membrane protein
MVSLAPSSKHQESVTLCRTGGPEPGTKKAGRVFVHLSSIILRHIQILKPRLIMKNFFPVLMLLVFIIPGCKGTMNMAGGDEIHPDFKATGNEPFWSLEIEFGNRIRFSSLTEEYPLITASLPADERPGDGSFMKHSAQTPKGTIDIRIIREECMDNMSGELFPFRVIVNTGGNPGGDYYRLEGCGQYLGKYRLNEIWILEKISGIPVVIPEGRQYPRMEIDLAGNSISGYGGCNRFHGRAKLVDGRLVTEDIASTKMACLDTQEIESMFLATLSGKTLEFNIDGPTLTLRDGKTELQFSRGRQ